MTHMTSFFKAGVALSLLSGAAVAEQTIIHAGTLLAVPGEAAKTDQSVVIEDGRIVRVEDGFIEAADATIIDLSDDFVMPGMMDMHVHIQGELEPGLVGDSNTLRLSTADIGMRSTLYARRTLMAGFTTVRDAGNDQPQINALRLGQQRGWVVSPRIVAAGGVGITGGHSDVDGMRHDLLEHFTTKQICDGGDDCTRATRRAIKFGGDFIKIAATGGVLSDTNTGTGQQMTNAELEAVVDTAHALGRKVAAHAHAAAGINAALRAGVDSVEHGSYADAESIRLFKENGAYLVPTLLAGATVVRMAEAGQIASPAIKAKALRVGKDLMDNFKRAADAEVKIAYGTDSGVSRHGNNAEEAVLMADAGMAPMDILKSATVNAADLISRSHDLGTIEPGKLADIIAMDGSPLSDIREVLSVDFVMQGGTVYKRQ